MSLITRWCSYSKSSITPCFISLDGVGKGKSSITLCYISLDDVVNSEYSITPGFMSLDDVVKYSVFSSSRPRIQISLVFFKSSVIPSYY